MSDSSPLELHLRALRCEHGVDGAGVLASLGVLAASLPLLLCRALYRAVEAARALRIASGMAESRRFGETEALRVEQEAPAGAAPFGERWSGGVGGVVGCDHRRDEGGWIAPSPSFHWLHHSVEERRMRDGSTLHLR